MTAFWIFYVFMILLTASLWYAIEAVYFSKEKAKNELVLTVISSVIWPVIWVGIGVVVIAKWWGNKLISIVEKYKK